MTELLEQELSYKIRGALFRVQGALGGGYQEKYYQRAVAEELKKLGLSFKEQLSMPLEYRGVVLGRYFLDFLIESRVVLEIKAAPRLYVRDVKQVLAYLKRSGIELGILANFGRSGLEIKRILKGRG